MTHDATQLALFDLEPPKLAADDDDPTPGKCPHEARYSDWAGGRSLCAAWGGVWTNCRPAGHCTMRAAERAKQANT